MTKEELTVENVELLERQALAELKARKDIEYEIEFSSWSFSMGGWGLVAYISDKDDHKQKISIEWPEEVLIVDTYVAIDKPACILNKRISLKTKIKLRLMYLIWLAYKYVQSNNTLINCPEREIEIWCHFDGRITKSIK